MRREDKDQWDPCRAVKKSAKFMLDDDAKVPENPIELNTMVVSVTKEVVRVGKLLNLFELRPCSRVSM